MKLLVRNLLRDTTESEIRTMFEAHGAVQSCTLVTDEKTGLSKGFGFVEMPKQGEAKVAMKTLNGTKVAGNVMRVKKAKPKLDTQNETQEKKAPENLEQDELTPEKQAPEKLTEKLEKVKKKSTKEQGDKPVYKHSTAQNVNPDRVGTKTSEAKTAGTEKTSKNVKKNVWGVPIDDDES